MSLQLPLKLCFIPFYGGPSHTFSLIDIARYFAFHGQQIVVLATPSNGKLIQKLLNNETISTDQQISLRIIHMPFKEAGLPEDFDELNEPQDIPTALKLYRAKDLLQHNVQKFLESEHCDCIISDSMYPWTADVAANLNIPCVSFNPYGIFSLCVREALRNPDFPHHHKIQSKDLLQHNVQKLLESEHCDCIISDSIYPWTADVAANLNIPCVSFNPYSVFSLSVREALRNPDSPHHHKIQSKEESFVISGLPVPITMTKSELPPIEYMGFHEEPLRAGELKCDIILTHSFQELESENIQYFSKVTGSKIITMGPACEIHRKISGRVERGHVTENKHESLSWLDFQKPNSVLYVNFGSMLKFPNEQLMEIACALESSGHNFLWVALRREEGEEEGEGKWLPIGFHEKTRDRGFLQKSWAPQLSILNHPSVGGFITHCGWNSVLEGFTAGVPMVTWPMTYEQFYNEKFVTQVAGVGVEVGGLEWEYYFNIGKKISRREKIEEAIRKLMAGGEKTEEMRKKAREYGKMAKRAVEEGGSTHRSMLDLIEEVKKLKMVKINNKTDAN